MMNALKAELADPAYAGLDDVDAALAVNSKMVTRTIDVPISLVEGHLRRNARVYALTEFLRLAPDGTPAEIKAAAFELVNTIASPRLQMIEMSKPDIAADMMRMLGALGPAGAGILTAADLATILGLSQEHVTWPVANGWSRDVDWHDVHVARGGM